MQSEEGRMHLEERIPAVKGCCSPQGTLFYLDREGDLTREGNHLGWKGKAQGQLAVSCCESLLFHLKEDSNLLRIYPLNDLSSVRETKQKLSQLYCSPRNPNQFVGLESNSPAIRVFKWDDKVQDVKSWTGIKLSSHQEYASSADYSPDGRRLVTGGWDKAICIHDMTGTPRTIHHLPSAHSNHVSALF